MGSINYGIRLLPSMNRRRNMSERLVLFCNFVFTRDTQFFKNHETLHVLRSFFLLFQVLNSRKEPRRKLNVYSHVPNGEPFMTRTKQWIPCPGHQNAVIPHCASDDNTTGYTDFLTTNFICVGLWGTQLLNQSEKKLQNPKTWSKDNTWKM
jgi:hypothetical protein